MNDLIVLYVFYGEKYCKEFIKSYYSLYNHNKNATVHVVTDSSSLLMLKSHYFDTSKVKINILESSDSLKGFEYKVVGICSIKLENFIYLDTDTIIHDSLESLLNLPDEFVVAGTYEPLVCSFKSNPWLQKPEGWKPDEYRCEVNTGVLVFNKKYMKSHFFDNWINFHRQLSILNQCDVPDQASFMQTIRTTRTQILTLGSEYNYRACFPQISYSKIYITHAHAWNYAKYRDKTASDSDDIVITTPWGLRVSRLSRINKLLTRLYKNFRKISRGF